MASGQCCFLRDLSDRLEISRFHRVTSKAPARVILLVAAGLLLQNSAFGQLREEQKAVLAFDVQASAIRDSPLQRDGMLWDRVLASIGEFSGQPQLATDKVHRVYGGSSQPYNLKSIIDFLQRPRTSPNAVAGGVDIGSAPEPGAEFEVEFEEPETPVLDGSENDLTQPGRQGERRIGARAVTPDRYQARETIDSDPLIGSARSIGASAGERPDELDVDPRPFEYFIRFVFVDESAAETVFASYRSEIFTEEDELSGGIVLYRPEDFSRRIRMWMPDNRTIEFGTELYMIQPTRQLFTERLMEQFSALPSAAIRVAMDVEAARQMLARIKVWLGTATVEEYQWVFKLFDNSAGMRLALDPGGGVVWLLAASGRNETAVGAVERGMARLLNESRQALAAPVNEPLEVYIPGISGLLARALNGVRPQRQGVEVAFSVSKPRDFDRSFARICFSSEYEGAVDRQFEVAWKAKLMLTAYEEIVDYEHRFHRLPFFVDESHSAQLSWRARIGGRANQFQLAEPWDSLNNSEHTMDVPLHLLKEDAPEGAGLTDVCRVVHTESPERFEDVRNPGQKIFLLQHPQGVAWTQNLDIAASDVRRIKASLSPGQWILAVMYDGSTRAITNRLSDAALEQMLDWKNR